MLNTTTLLKFIEDEEIPEEFQSQLYDCLCLEKGDDIESLLVFDEDDLEEYLIIYRNGIFAALNEAHIASVNMDKLVEKEKNQFHKFTYTEQGHTWNHTFYLLNTTP
jgi:hypothetical protein